MTEPAPPTEAIPARLVDILDRHDDRTLAAVRAYCDERLDESELEHEFDDRSF